MVWDRGTWTPKADPTKGMRRGRLKFDLDGEKLKGGWNLVRSRSGKYGGENSWLLFKEADEFARLGAEGLIAEDRPESVVSGRSLEQIAVDADRVWHSNKSVAANVKGGAIRKPGANIVAGLAKIKGARKAPLPDLIEAQLATAVKSPPTGPAWVHEIKYDGYRMLCRIAHQQARMVSRNANDWTVDFDALARALALLPVDDAWLDGEVIALDAGGRTSFQALQKALSAADSRGLKYLAFDLLHLNGVDLRGVALKVAQAPVARAPVERASSDQYSEHFAVPGPAFLQNVGELGLEGMISKRADLPYRGGRGPAWQKIKCMRRQEMVIGGFTDPEGSRHGFGALLLGVYEPDGRLAYSGKVGTGFSDASLAALSRSLSAIAQKESPFHNPPRGAEARRAHWVRPTLVAEVSFAEWTDDGTLRHPSFLGLRADKRATRSFASIRRHRTSTRHRTSRRGARPRAPSPRRCDKNASLASFSAARTRSSIPSPASASATGLATLRSAHGCAACSVAAARFRTAGARNASIRKKGGVNEAISRVNRERRRQCRFT
jgi:bifunctional non-homologous end joining protein LigD